MKPMFWRLARFEHRFSGSHREVVHVLHRHDRRDLLGGLELLDVHLGQPDVADLALLLQLHELTDLVLGREFVVDAVQLEQVDGVHAEAAQAHLAFLTQVRREAEDRPLVGPGAQQAGLGRDDEPVRVGVQRLFDQFLGHVRAVGVRRCR